MRKIAIVLGIFSILFLLTNSIYAQENINGTVVVSKSGDITLNDANKINSIPSLEDTVFPIKAFEYKIYENKLPTPFIIDPIKPAKLAGEPIDKLYNNYVAVGFGNLTTPYLDVFHGSMRSKDTRYSFHAKHISSRGSFDDYAFPGYSNSLIEGNFSKALKKAVFETDLSYKRDGYHFYGIKSDTIDDKENAQYFNIFSIGGGLKSIESRKDKFEYQLGTKYNLFSDKFKNNEHNIALDFGTFFKMSAIKNAKDQKIGIEGDFNYFVNTFSEIDNQNDFLLSLGPVLKFKYSSLTASIGANGEIYNEDTTTLLKLSPALHFKLGIIDDKLFVNLSIAGGMKRNTLLELTNINPFLASNIPMKFSENSLNLNFGATAKVIKNLSADAQLFFEKWDNVPFFILDSNGHQNKFNLIYDSYEMIKFRIGATYQNNEHYKIIAQVNLYDYTTKTISNAYYKPNFDAKLIGIYNIQDKFIARGELITYGKTMGASFVGNNLIENEIKPWIDLNLGVEYRYNKKLSLFVNTNNISASKYFRWTNYPIYRFNVLAGFTYIF